MYVVCLYNKQKRTMYDCIIKEKDDISALQSAVVNKQLPINLSLLEYKDMYQCKVALAKEGLAVATCEISHGQQICCIYDLFTDVFKFIPIIDNKIQTSKDVFQGFLDFQGRIDVITLCLNQTTDINYLTQVLSQVYVKIAILNSKNLYRPSVDKYQNTKYQIDYIKDLSIDSKSKLLTIACKDTVQKCTLQTDITINSKDSSKLYTIENIDDIDDNDIITSVEISIVDSTGKINVIELKSLNYVILNIQPYSSKAYFLFIYPFLMSIFKKTIYTPNILIDNINTLVDKYK